MKTKPKDAPRRVNMKQAQLQQNGRMGKAATELHHDLTAQADKVKTRPPVTRIVRYTPALAEAILTSRNTLNRDIRDRRVEKYANDMRNGRWEMNGETIKFTKTGQLLDGQHRLWAVFYAGVPIDMLTVEGLEDEVMPTIDTGAPRGFADVAKIGGNSYAALLAGVVKWVHWYENGRGAHLATANASHAELNETLRANPDIAERIAEIVGYKKAKKIMRPSVAGFIYLYAYRTDPAKAEYFLELLETGEGLKHGDPVHALRERLINIQLQKAKLPAMDIAALIIKTWNAFLTGRRMVLVRWTKNEAFPTFAKLEK